MIRVDPKLLQQALLNLLTNAVQYNHPGGSVVVSDLRTEEEQVCVEVTDTGQGIDPAARDQIFEPFNRLGRVAGVMEGTGIGLTVAKELVERMDGIVGFESTPGLGLSFWFEFPTISGRAKKARDWFFMLMIMPRI